MNDKYKHLISAVALAGLAALALGSSSKKSGGESGGATSSSDTAKIGDAVNMDDSTWTVVSASNLGKTLKAPSGLGEDKTTDGQFVLVQYKVTNTGKQDESILEGPKVVDAKSREFGSFQQESLYLPEGQTSILLEKLPPNIAKTFSAIYELPSDATGLKLQVRSLGAFASHKLVDLGNLPLPTPAQAAAAAPAAKGAAAPAHPAGHASAASNAAPHKSAGAPSTTPAKK